MNILFAGIRYLFFGLALLATSLLLTNSADAQQVAHYSVGEKTNKFESFSFSVDDGEIGEITYWYGKDSGEWFGNKGKEVKLTYLGKDSLKGEACFKVQFPNNYILYIIPKGLNLKIVDGTGKYSKLFGWQYVGPINGVGMFCQECADEKESMKLIKQYYLN
jgi:hypothetical protein